jgi:hypothetical protein
MVAGGYNSSAEAIWSIAIGTNVMVSSSAEYAVAVSAYRSIIGETPKLCAATEPGSLTLCADKNVTIQGSALVVNGEDVLMTTSNLKAELLNTKAELAVLKAQVAALKSQAQTSPASGSLVGTLLALSLAAAAVA